MTNANKPIHPILNGGVDSDFTGLTKREYFSGLILSTLISNVNINSIRKIDDELDRVAQISIAAADLLIKNLKDE